LCDGEDTFAAERLALLRAHTGQQAEIVLFQSFLTTAVTEFAYSTVPVQNEVGRRSASQQRRYLPDEIVRLADQTRHFNLQSGVVVPVDDLAHAELSPDHFGQHERVERRQQPVVFGELVEEDEPDWDKLVWLPFF
jgi:hypothetical protein